MSRVVLMSVVTMLLVACAGEQPGDQIGAEQDQVSMVDITGYVGERATAPLTLSHPIPYVEQPKYSPRSLDPEGKTEAQEPPEWPDCPGCIGDMSDPWRRQFQDPVALGDAVDQFIGEHATVSGTLNFDPSPRAPGVELMDRAAEHGSPTVGLQFPQQFIDQEPMYEPKNLDQGESEAQEPPDWPECPGCLGDDSSPSRWQFLNPVLEGGAEEFIADNGTIVGDLNLDPWAQPQGIDRTAQRAGELVTLQYPAPFVQVEPMYQPKSLDPDGKTEAQEPPDWPECPGCIGDNTSPSRWPF